MGKFYRDMVRLHSKARGSARAVLNVLADYADDDGLAWPGRALIANDAGMSERNVIRCLKALDKERRISVESNGAGGRGNHPVYKIWFPEIGQPAPAQAEQSQGKRVTTCHPSAEQEDDVKGDKLSQRETGCHPLGEKRVTNEQQKGDKLSLKGDKSVPIPSHARIEPQEPHLEPKRERAQAHPAPTVVATGIPGAATLKLDSPYLKDSKFVNGFIPPGTGRNAVEVYYERFEIRSNNWRLTAPQEDDLVRQCKDLVLLREVVTAYDQANFEKPRNMRLIFDWYRDPSRFREGQNGQNRRNNQANYRQPEVAQFTTAERDTYNAQQIAAGRPF